MKQTSPLPSYMIRTDGGSVVFCGSHIPSKLCQNRDVWVMRTAYCPGLLELERLMWRRFGTGHDNCHSSQSQADHLEKYQVPWQYLNPAPMYADVVVDGPPEPRKPITRIDWGSSPYCIFDQRGNSIYWGDASPETICSPQIYAERCEGCPGLVELQRLIIRQRNPEELSKFEHVYGHKYGGPAAQAKHLDEYIIPSMYLSNFQPTNFTVYRGPLEKRRRPLEDQCNPGADYDYSDIAAKILSQIYE